MSAHHYSCCCEEGSFCAYGDANETNFLGCVNSGDTSPPGTDHTAYPSALLCAERIPCPEFTLCSGCPTPNTALATVSGLQLCTGACSAECLALYLACKSHAEGTYVLPKTGNCSWGGTFTTPYAIASGCCCCDSVGVPRTYTIGVTIGFSVPGGGWFINGSWNGFGRSFTFGSDGPYGTCRGSRTVTANFGPACGPGNCSLTANTISISVSI